MQSVSNAVLLQMINKLTSRLSLLESNLNNSKSRKVDTIRQKDPLVTKKSITHQVIVTSDNSVSMAKETFASKVKSNLQTVPINTIKVSKDGYGVIEFPDQAARDDGLSKLKDDFNVQPNNRPYRHLLPKITISGIVSSDYKNTDTSKLKTDICQKNPILNDLMSKGKIFDILFIKEDYRRENYSIAAVAVEEEVYHAIKSMRFKIYVDFSCCRVNDRFHVTQCYNCQKFGHTKANCPQMTSNIQVCRYCTKNHNGKNCPHKGNQSMFKCANCGQNHSTTYAGCPILRNQVETLAKRTKCMEQFSKNDIRSNVIVT